MDPLTHGLIRLAGMAVGKFIDGDGSHAPCVDKITPEQKAAAERAEWDSNYTGITISEGIIGSLFIAFAALVTPIDDTIYNIDVRIIISIVGFAILLYNFIMIHDDTHSEFKRLRSNYNTPENNRRYNKILNNLYCARAYLYLCVLQCVAVIYCLYVNKQYTFFIYLLLVFASQLIAIALSIMLAKIMMLCTRTKLKTK